MSLTTDPKDPRLGKGIDENQVPQNEVYLVLSDEERAKGFVRPVRRTYIHKGRFYGNGVEAKEYIHDGKTYVAIAIVCDAEGKRIGGSYITQAELDQYNETGGYVGGCGTVTTMNQVISETYARNPNFYGATYCCACRKHLPVSEFLWDGTNEKVGS